MGVCKSTTSRRQSSESTGRIGQGEISGGCQELRPHMTSIHVLDDDSILHVFYLYRPFFWDEDEIADWNYNARWLYALAHVCRRWRNIVLGSANYLGLSLLCIYGTPVADMLALSPPLPLVICYFKKVQELTADDEKGIILALKQRDRVRRVRLGIHLIILQKFIVVMDEEYPILEYLYIMLPIQDYNTIPKFPESFQAPHLRHLSLDGFALPIGSRLLATAVDLVKLHLNMIHPSTYFHPNTLLRWISLLPHLETLIIRFEFSLPNPDVGRQLTHTHTAIIAPITLPNLHCFEFQGVSACLEALVHQISAPRLEQLYINVLGQLTFSVPRLQQFTNITENLRFGNARVAFFDKLAGVAVNPYGETEVDVLSIIVNYWDLNVQVSSMAHISDSLGQIFSTVEHLSLLHDVHLSSSGEHDEVDRTEWRYLLRPFRNVKTLRIEKGLVKDLSRSLALGVGELLLALLPELHELEYVTSDDTGDAFNSFIDARRNAGRPVILVRW